MALPTYISFTPGTRAKASEVNANFTETRNILDGQLEQSNFDTMTGTINWVVTGAEEAINITHSGSRSAIKITHSGIPAAGEAAFRIDCLTSGVLLPRMTTAQRDAITNTSEAMLLWNTSTSFWNTRVGGSWLSLTMGQPDSSTLERSSDILRIKDLGVSTTKIADAAVTGAKIEASPTITTSVKITAGGPTLTSVSSKTLGVSDGTTVRSAVVSTNPSSHGLMVVRGQVSDGGAANVGEGYSSVKTGTGAYTVTFSTAFTDTPVVVTTAQAVNNLAYIISVSTSSVSIATRRTADGVSEDSAFNFIAIGQRA
jgi:hypothetical protein